MASVLSLSCLFKHLFRLVVHLLSFRRSVLGSTTAVLLDHVSRDWNDVTVVLVALRWTPRRFHISATTAIVFLFPSWHCNQDIAVWKNFRKVRRSRCCSFRRSSLAILCWTCWSSASGSSPEWMILYALWFSNFSINHLTLFSRVVFCCSTAERGKVPQIFCDPRCCYRFHRYYSNRSMVPKMILRLGFVDLVDHIASSILARLVALSELSEPYGRAHPEFTYIPLSQCKLQAVCCRERLQWPCLVKL